ncbi:hypothetical protein ACQJBY_023167 [Aegilops geniculata]
MRGIFSLTMAPLLRPGALAAALLALAVVGVAQGQQVGLLRVPNRSPPTKANMDRVVLPVDNAGGFAGSWNILSENAGVSAMHLVVMRHGKAVMFDTTTTGPSLMQLPAGNCRVDPRSDPPGGMDCSAHAVEFDYNTGAVRPLKILTDTWCSSGAFDVDGMLVQTGGYFEGVKVVRRLNPQGNADWIEFPNTLAEGRWYATQQVLPDGRFIVVGGRRSFSYEFVPAAGHLNTQFTPLPLLQQTTDDVENNLYPFVHLLPEGTVFLFANDRSIVFDPQNGQVLRELPKLNGGARNYPASGMSALLPLDLRRGERLSAEVIVCGGAPKEAFKLGEANKFPHALRDCGRINPSKPGARWAIDFMPVGRVMGDMLILPTGDLLLLNGAAQGCSGWVFAREPVLTPLLYSPRKRRGARFRALAASNIPRMYHSSSAVLPDATVLVAGGNTNSAYNFSGVDFPTEVRVERYTPPYLAPELVATRPEIDLASVPANGVKYGDKLTLRFTSRGPAVTEADMKVTMYAPPFTTHGFSQNQRLLVLQVAAFKPEGNKYKITAQTPSKPTLAPPGYYLVFVMVKGVPSKAAWVKIHP